MDFSAKLVAELAHFGKFAVSVLDFFNVGIDAHPKMTEQDRQCYDDTRYPDKDVLDCHATNTPNTPSA